MAGQVRYETVTIISGAAVSNAITLQPGEHIVGVEVPAAWTAADLGVDVARDGTNFIPVSDPARAAGQQHFRITSIAVNEASIFLMPQTGIFYTQGGGALRLHSVATGASNADVNQGADRILWILISKDN